MEKKKKIKNALILGGAALALGGSMVLVHKYPEIAIIANSSAKVKADQVAPSFTTIEIHKTMYDKKDAEFFEQEQNKIKNDGTQKESTFSDKLLHYNPETMGKIEFTLYDITDQINKTFPDGKGLTGFTSGQSKEAQGRVAEISNDINEHGEKSRFLTGATVVGTKAIDGQGNVRFENVKAYDASKPQKYHYYAAVETKTPKGFVVAKAKPIVFVNPYTNPTNDQFLTTTYLYPKNNTQKLKFDLTKFAIWYEKENGTPAEKKELEGAKFQLYLGKAGHGTKVGGVLTTDAKGKVTADNLIMGDYYFVELESSVATDNPEAKAQAKVAISSVAKNNANNKLTFSIGENGIEPNKLQGSLVDYGTPTITKKLTNGIGEHRSLHIGDLAHFKSKVNVPANIMGSDWQIDATGTQAKTEPYHVFFTRDEPQKHLKDVPEERHLVIKTSDNKITLQEGTDYKVITGKNKWWVNFVVKDVSKEDQAKLDSAAKSGDNAKIQEAIKNQSSGSVSDIVAKEAGKHLNYDYDEVVMTDSPMDTDIVNDIYLDWNDGSGFKEIKRSDKTVTYGIHFVKETSGFMGTGIAAQKLQGAKFVVQDLRTGKWFNGWKDAKNTTTGEKQAQWVDSYKEVEAGVLTSDKEGKFELQGFTEGDYKLREIKAPAGHQLMEETMNFKIGPNTDKQTIATPIAVKNNEKTTMPLTGSQVLLLSAVGGVVTITVVGVGYGIYKKKHA